MLPNRKFNGSTNQILDSEVHSESEISLHTCERAHSLVFLDVQSGSWKDIIDRLFESRSTICILELPNYDRVVLIIASYKNSYPIHMNGTPNAKVIPKDATMLTF